MKRKKEILVLGFALFSMFFGAGNLIFPPSVGVAVGSSWKSAGLGFFLTGIGLPLLGILAFTKVGNLDNFANKVSTWFNTTYSTILILVIGPLFAIPRTGSVTFEMGIKPLIGSFIPTTSAAIFSAILFFGTTYLLVINESSITDILGKFLTPIILIVLLFITFSGIFLDLGTPTASSISGNQFTYGFINGYQTMDALASVLFGVIIINGLKDKGINEESEQKKYLVSSSFIAAAGLGFIYLSLIFLGAQISGTSRGLATSSITLKLAELTLGRLGKFGFGLCVGAACLTTSVGLVALASDWFSKLLKIKYKTLALIICIFSGAFSVVGLDSIIKFSVPVLTILYPVTIVLIFLNILGIKNHLIFKLVTGTTLIISILTVLKVNLSYLPLGTTDFSWLIPAIIAFIIGGASGYFIKKPSEKENLKEII